jgi:hypothetical protein
MLKQWQNMGLTTINDTSTVWMTKKIMKPMEMGGVGNQYTTRVVMSTKKYMARKPKDMDEGVCHF